MLKGFDLRVAAERWAIGAAMGAVTVALGGGSGLEMLAAAKIGFLTALGVDLRAYKRWLDAKETSGPAGTQ